MDDSAAAREAGWSTLGAQTGQISTVARVATSKTAQKSLKDAEGNLNPIAIASLASSVSSGLSGLSRSGGGSIMRGLQQNLSWSQFNPVAGVSAIAGGANRMYSTLAGTSAVNFQSGPPDAYVAAGQEYYGSDITNTPIQGPGIAPTITVSPVSQGYTSQRYGGVDRLTAMSGNETLGSVDARQNWLPTLGGAANLGRDIFNVAVFGSMQPTIGENKRPIGFRRTTPRDTLLRQTRY
jgi:hypothetical protein